MDATALESFFDEMEKQHSAIMQAKEYVCTPLRSLVWCFSQPLMSVQRRGNPHDALFWERLRCFSDFLSADRDQLNCDLHLDAEGRAVCIYERLGFVHCSDELRASETTYPMIWPHSGGSSSQLGLRLAHVLFA